MVIDGLPVTYLLGGSSVQIALGLQLRYALACALNATSFSAVQLTGVGSAGSGGSTSSGSSSFALLNSSSLVNGGDFTLETQPLNATLCAAMEEEAVGGGGSGSGGRLLRRLQGEGSASPSSSPPSSSYVDFTVAVAANQSALRAVSGGGSSSGSGSGGGELLAISVAQCAEATRIVTALASFVEVNATVAQLADARLNSALAPFVHAVDAAAAPAALVIPAAPLHMLALPLVWRVGSGSGDICGLPAAPSPPPPLFNAAPTAATATLPVAVGASVGVLVAAAAVFAACFAGNREYKRRRKAVSPFAKAAEVVVGAANARGSGGGGARDSHMSMAVSSVGDDDDDDNFVTDDYFNTRARGAGAAAEDACNELDGDENAGVGLPTLGVAGNHHRLSRIAASSSSSRVPHLDLVGLEFPSTSSSIRQLHRMVPASHAPLISTARLSLGQSQRSSNESRFTFMPSQLTRRAGQHEAGTSVRVLTSFGPQQSALSAPGSGFMAGVVVASLSGGRRAGPPTSSHHSRSAEHQQQQQRRGGGGGRGGGAGEGSESISGRGDDGHAYDHNRDFQHTNSQYLRGGSAATAPRSPQKEPRAAFSSGITSGAGVGVGFTGWSAAHNSTAEEGHEDPTHLHPTTTFLVSNPMLMAAAGVGSADHHHHQQQQQLDGTSDHDEEESAGAGVGLTMPLGITHWAARRSGPQAAAAAHSHEAVDTGYTGWDTEVGGLGPHASGASTSATFTAINPMARLRASRHAAAESSALAAGSAVGATRGGERAGGAASFVHSRAEGATAAPSAPSTTSSRAAVGQSGPGSFTAAGRDGNSVESIDSTAVAVVDASAGALQSPLTAPPVMFSNSLHLHATALRKASSPPPAETPTAAAVAAAAPFIANSVEAGVGGPTVLLEVAPVPAGFEEEETVVGAVAAVGPTSADGGEESISLAH